MTSGGFWRSGASEGAERKSYEVSSEGQNLLASNTFRALLPVHNGRNYSTVGTSPNADRLAVAGPLLCGQRRIRPADAVLDIHHPGIG
jgi:hypothetical protein